MIILGILQKIKLLGKLLRFRNVKFHDIGLCHLVSHETGVVILKFGEHLQDLDELVFFTYFITFVFRAKREATVSFEQTSSANNTWTRVVVFDWLQACEHVWQNAAQGPHIDFVIIFLLNEDDLWWSIPSRNNMVGQVSFFVSSLLPISLKYIFSLLELLWIMIL